MKDNRGCSYLLVASGCPSHFHRYYYPLHYRCTSFWFSFFAWRLHYWLVSFVCFSLSHSIQYHYFFLWSFCVTVSSLFSYFGQYLITRQSDCWILLNGSFLTRRSVSPTKTKLLHRQVNRNLEELEERTYL